MTSYKVESVEAGSRNLVHLLSVICDIRFELGVNEDDERIDSLLWIARDLAEGVLKCEEETILASRRRNGGSAP